jgi:diguanylate cyclase (GGDEF)-like protein/PAS domain S-box-containing protein/putative nucleotidyltransferase with HDIG domain
VAADPATHADPFPAAGVEALLVVGADGLVLDGNRAAQEVIAPGGEPLVGRSIWDLPIRQLGPGGEVVGEAEHPVRRVLATGQPAERITIGVEHPLRGMRWLEGVAVPLRDSVGRVWAVAVSFGDVTGRIEREAALRESEAAFRLLAENASDVILRIDPHGRLLYLSPSIERLSGRTPDALVGLDVFANVHPDDRERLVAALGSLREGAPTAAATVRLRHADGHWLWVESLSRAVRGAGGTLAEVHSALRPATARVRAERVLGAVAFTAERLLREGPRPAALEEVLARLGEAAEAGRACLLRIRSGLDGIARTEVHAAWGAPCRIGAGPDDALDAGWAADLAKGRSVAAEGGGASLVMVPVMSGGGLWGALSVEDTELPRRWGPAEVAALEAAGDVVGAAIERGRAERALQASEERFRAAVDAIDAGVAVLAPVGGPGDLHITDLNAAAAAVLGRPREALLGRPLVSVAPAVAAWGLLALCARVITSGVAEHGEDRFVLPATGEARWLRYRVSPLGRECVLAFDDVTALREREAEEAALRRLAVEVAEAAPEASLFAALAREAAALFGAQRALVGRFRDGALVVAGSEGPGAPGPGSVIGRGDWLSLIPRARSVRVEPRAGDEPEALVPAGGTVVAARVTAGDRPWGAILVGSGPGDPLPRETETGLERFAALAGMAVKAAEQRSRLERLAATDPLTGLANHRAFHERLAAEVARAGRHGRGLALVMLDLDHFKEVNDSLGHSAGDRVLVEVAERLAACARPEDLVARIGGEEFAWLLPEADGPGALDAAERARAAVATGAPGGVADLTTSAGICDLERARGSAQAMVDLADGALYWAKATGRDRAVLYSPEVVRELSAEERAERLERSRELSALRALARAVDARDHSTREHSERVAGLACRLAASMGWPEARVALMRDAALLHDVGKIGVPDAILFKPGRPTEAEWAQLRLHATLGAEIVDEALSAEQAAWVRHHHERWDGLGYPDGLAREAIPEGARILALADAWDAMTAARPYGEVLSTEAALAEVREGEGVQFCPHASTALLALAAADALG